jgi:hypothetical protein
MRRAVLTWTRKNRIASACNIGCTFFARGRKSSSTHLAKNRTPSAGYSKLPRQKKQRNIISTLQKRKIERKCNSPTTPSGNSSQENKPRSPPTPIPAHAPISQSNHPAISVASVSTSAPCTWRQLVGELMRLLGFRGLWGWEGVVKMSGHMGS